MVLTLAICIEADEVEVSAVLAHWPLPAASRLSLSAWLARMPDPVSTFKLSMCFGTSFQARNCNLDGGFVPNWGFALVDSSFLVHFAVLTEGKLTPDYFTNTAGLLNLLHLCADRREIAASVRQSAGRCLIGTLSRERGDGLVERVERLFLTRSSVTEERRKVGALLSHTFRLLCVVCETILEYSSWRSDDKVARWSSTGT